MTNSGIWTNNSDRSSKENFNRIDNQQILEQLAALPITDWNYKVDDDSIRHIGPVAQDFYDAFQLGDNPAGIGTIDAEGVALAAIQGLYQRVVELENENASLQQEIDTLAGVGSERSSMQVFIYVLTALVILLLAAFGWIVLKFRSLAPAGGANDS